MSAAHLCKKWVFSMELFNYNHMRYSSELSSSPISGNTQIIAHFSFRYIQRNLLWQEDALNNFQIIITLFLKFHPNPPCPIIAGFCGYKVQYTVDGFYYRNNNCFSMNFNWLINSNYSRLCHYFAEGTLSLSYGFHLVVIEFIWPDDATIDETKLQTVLWHFIWTLAKQKFIVLVADYHLKW